MNIIEKFNRATALMNENKLEEAAEIFLSLNMTELAPFCYYRLAQISNMTGDPEVAYNLYYKAFTAKPDLAATLYGKEHSSFTYVFSGMKEEKEITDCPLCGRQGSPRWTYPLAEAGGYNPFFNPVRMWMYCADCNHMFARHFPEKLFLHNDSPRNANPGFFAYYSNVLHKIRQYAQGMTLFEVGIGAGECLLSAREIGYECFGIDVIPRHVDELRNKYGLDVATYDFVEYETDKKWDVIIMGDVLEHVSDPIQAIKKAADILTEDGALWVSTPNFESAFSQAVGHNDAMRRQQYHVNYFSRESFYMLLEKADLIPVDYHISQHYNGSMEVIAVKSSRIKK
ncbi:class I SAM-dependent methyltransferase [Sporomusa sp. GT1]|uniref:class I SAM-dependent methyltransferase n=1 Tax=Sporomusa sp. GT1 TaxID=1534747 RepID=UPI00166DE62E|nr:class I SAM-dependent methyltransferase [Sporomusa sp. GT1]